jgi:hypothetical protein
VHWENKSDEFDPGLFVGRLKTQETHKKEGEREILVIHVI